MPSFGIHMIVMDEVHQKLRQSALNSDNVLAEMIDDNKEITSLGAIGPDLFYYLDNEPKFAGVVSTIFKDLNKIPDFLSQAAQLATGAGMPNFNNLVSQLTDTAKLMLTTLEATLTVSLTDLMSILSGSKDYHQSEEQQELPQSQWKWGDILHDRYSGVFSSMINNQAMNAGNPSWMAYAAGYKSHLITDFVGHPYVNQCVGGPARSWDLRHTIAECFMDQKAYVKRGADINMAKIDKRFDGLSDNDVKALTQMLAEQLNVLIQVSGGPAQFPDDVPDADDLEEAYHRMIGLFGFATSDNFVPPPVRPNIVIPPLPGQYGSITNAIGSLLPPSGRHFTLADILKLLLYALLLLPSVLIDLARAAVDITIGVLSYPMRALLYLFQTYLYKLYRSVRWFLVCSGVAFPCPDELNSDLGKQFITCHNPDDVYPRRPPDFHIIEDNLIALGRVLTFQSTNQISLNYPSGQPIESPSTLSSVYPAGVDPEYFINTLQMDPVFLAQWQTINKPSDLKHIVPFPHGLPSIAGFGNAVDLTHFYINNDNLFRKINIDADRGYGYNQWACDNGSLQNGILTNEIFL